MPRRAALLPVPPNEIIHIGARKRLLSSALYLGAIGLRGASVFRKSRPQRVLVLEPVGLGDVISFEPLVRELLARNYEVVVCAKPEWKALFPERPRQTWCNLRLPWATHNEKIKYDPGRYLAEPARGDLRTLRTLGQGAIGIDTRGDIRSVLLLYWAGCRRVLSLSNYLGSDLRMSPFAAEIIPFDNSLRRWQLNARFLEGLDKEADSRTVSRPRLSHLISRTDPRRVALMPIAPWEGKLWARDRWREVASCLEREGREVVILCGPGQTAAAREQVGADFRMVECGSIESWAREFNECAFVITVDSGPMHLADALDVPVIALFGQGKLPLWAPSGERSLVIAHRDAEFFVCHPVVANTYLGRKYMDLISAAEVLAAVRKINGA